MANSYNLLHKNILSVLSQTLGEPLKAVIYHFLEYECDLEYAQNDPIYTGGGVELRFDAKVFITWNSNLGWQDAFAIEVVPSNLINGTYEPIDASSSPLWRNKIGTNLESFRILGWEGVPHIIEFNFKEATVYIGNGYELVFGDGDDIIISSKLSTSQYFTPPETIWSSQ